MTNHTHADWTDRLSEYRDGGLAGDELRAVEEHLAGCAGCRLVLAELDDVVRAARALDDAEPARDLWPGIAAAIGAPPSAPPSDVIRLPTARRDRRRAGIYLSVRQLAAASVVLVLASAAATWWAGVGLAPRGGAPPLLPMDGSAALVADVAAPPADIADELRLLERTLVEARGRLEPNTLRILEKHLGVIERAIAESRSALELDPGNAFLRRHLERAYRDKADYLREAAGIADWVS